MKKYYSVMAKCGHVGRFNCVYVDFAICAGSAKEAASRVKEFARVKRHHKDAIKEVKEITIQQYYSLREKNQNDPYLHCNSVQEQNSIENFEQRILVDEYNVGRLIVEKGKRDVTYKIRRIKEQEFSKAQEVREYFLMA